MALLRGSNGNGGKKRTWDEAAIASDAANNDFKLNGHGRMSTSDALDAINPFNHPDMEQVLPTGLHTTGPTQVAVELPRIAEEVNFGFPIQPQPHESILFPDEDDFTPSLFYHMNFARYPPSAGPRMEDLIHAVGISIEELQHNI